jgi:hypothetical protein
MGMAKRWALEQEEIERIRQALDDLDLTFPWSIDETDTELTWQSIRSHNVDWHIADGDVLISIERRSIEECICCGRLFTAVVDDPDCICSSCFDDAVARDR